MRSGDSLQPIDQAPRRGQRLSSMPTRVMVSGDKGEPAPGFVIEVSKDGCRIRIASALHPGNSIRIDFERNHLVGQVRYCRALGSGEFEAGISIEHFQETIASR